MALIAVFVLALIIEQLAPSVRGTLVTSFRFTAQR